MCDTGYRFKVGDRIIISPKVRNYLPDLVGLPGTIIKANGQMRDKNHDGHRWWYDITTDKALEYWGTAVAIWECHVDLESRPGTADVW